MSEIELLNELIKGEQENILFVLTVFIFTGCSDAAGCNRGCVDVSYKYDYAKVKINDTWRTVQIKKWYDYEGEQLQLELKDGTTLLISSTNCILYSGNLPE